MFALKLRLVQYDAFFGCQNQEDASECPMMLIKLINKGSEPLCGSNDNNSTGVSLSEILISFILNAATLKRYVNQFNRKCQDYVCIK